MSLTEITQKLLTAKENKGLTFAELAEVLQSNEVWIASVIYRQASVSLQEAKLL